MSADERPPEIEEFLGEPTRDLRRWKWLWDEDVEFPIRSDRGLFGRLVVGVKRLIRPLVSVPQNDLWERQRVFNLIVLEQLELIRTLPEENRKRIEHLEKFSGLAIRHNDALFARVDQKLDRYRRQTEDLLSTLGHAVTLAEQGIGGGEIERARVDYAYLDFENQFRGSEEEIVRRAERYLERIEGLDPVLDLGCGRGEALTRFAAAGHQVRGVDSNVQMVAHCVEQGLEVHEGDLLEELARQREGSLGAIVSFHVIEHLPIETVDRLVRLAHRALRSGGVLILETPNPLSVVVAARNFWLDPTHLRPVHPDYLLALADQAGFDRAERVDCNPFPPAVRLPEIPPQDDPNLAEVVDRVNRLRDRLDDLLFGAQDYALLAHK